MSQLKSVIGIIAGLVCVLATVVIAAEGILGEWEFRSKIEERKMDASISFSKNADGTYSGTWSGQWGQSELTEVSFAEGKLKFVRTMNWGGNESKTTYEATLAEEKLKGTGKSDWGESIIEAVRQGEEKAEAGSIVGGWEMTITIPERIVIDKMTVTKNEDGSLAATWVSERGENTIADLKCEEGRVSFTRKGKMGQMEWESRYDGVLEGDEIKGVFMSDWGEMEVNAKRAGMSEKPKESET